MDAAKVDHVDLREHKELRGDNGTLAFSAAGRGIDFRPPFAFSGFFLQEEELRVNL